MRIFWVLLLIVGLGGCATTEEGPVAATNTPEEIAAAQQVLDRIGDRVADTAPTGSVLFEMGTLDDGVAVLLRQVSGKQVDAAFWTRGPAIFVVNDTARRIDNRLPDAPEEITMERVLAVVH